MSQTTRFDLPYLAEGQASPEVSHNEGLDILASMLGVYVEDRDLTTPPALVEGNVYIVGDSASGLWLNKDGQFAAAINGAWQFTAPENGQVFYVADEAGGGIYTGGFNFRQLAPRIAIRRSSTLALSGKTDVGWNAQIVVDGHFTHSTSVNTEQIGLPEDGLYEAQIALTFERTAGTGEQVVWVGWYDGINLVPTAEAYATFDGQYHTVNLERIDSMSQPYCKVRAEHVSGGGTVRLAATGNYCKITRP